MESQYAYFFTTLKTKTILVIGDVMVDAYLWGKVDRISPEAPVPVVAVRKRENRLGGAANVALNIRAMGAQAILLSVVGDDVKGREFAALLEQAGLPSDGMIYSADRITTTKFRVIGNKVQLLRVDEESEEALNPLEQEAISRRFSDLIGKHSIDAIVFQDYDKGVISPGLIRSVMKEAHQAGIPVAVDPKKKNFFEYKGARLFKPNLKELREGLKLDQVPEGDKLEEAVSLLQAELQAEIVMVTLSEKGVFIRHKEAEKTQSWHLPAQLRNISDVSGAGDTVISLAVLGLACALPLPQLAEIANRAGGLVCEEVGVVPINADRLMQEVGQAP